MVPLFYLKFFVSWQEQGETMTCYIPFWSEKWGDSKYEQYRPWISNPACATCPCPKWNPKTFSATSVDSPTLVVGLLPTRDTQLLPHCNEPLQLRSNSPLLSTCNGSLQVECNQPLMLTCNQAITSDLFDLLVGNFAVDHYSWLAMTCNADFRLISVRLCDKTSTNWD